MLISYSHYAYNFRPCARLKVGDKFLWRIYPTCVSRVWCDSSPRTVRKEERWARDKSLGAGASGTVYLEKSITENGEVQHRAVKEIRKSAHKSGAIDYSRELEAMAKFSHPKVRGLSIFNSFFLDPLLLLPF